MNEDKIILKDGSNDKNFIIKKMTAMQSFFFINKILAIISNAKIDLGNEYKEKCIQIIENMTKIYKTEDVDKKNYKINESEILPIFFSVIKSALAETTEDKLNEVHNILLKQCFFVNGISVKNINIYNADEFIEDFSTIYKLIIESAKFNFGFFLKEKTL